MILGERFGCLPWHLEDAPADRLAYYVGLLSVEGEFAAATADLPDGEDLILVE